MTGGAAQSLDALLRPGQLVEVGALTTATGGTVSNTGLALHRLGMRTSLMGKVGADVLGEMVQQVIGHYDPALVQGMVVDKSAATSYTVILSAPGVDRNHHVQVFVDTVLKIILLVGRAGVEVLYH